MGDEVHGGKRVGAGRPRVSEVQVTARVSSAASKSIQAHGPEEGIAAALRLMADYATGVRARIPAQSEVLVSFQPLPGSKAKDVEQAYREIVERLVGAGAKPNAYKCGSELLTVKARVPIGNGSSLWLSVPARRLRPPSAKDYNMDMRKIKAFLIDLGLDPTFL